tara:strand:+ start:335 stop:460 length:126 start_codon:yes stop_codon:yes gene_type:complete
MIKDIFKYFLKLLKLLSYENEKIITKKDLELNNLSYMRPKL